MTHEIKITGPNAGKDEWIQARYLCTQVADANGYLAVTRNCYHHFIDSAGKTLSVRHGSENTIRPLPGFRCPSAREIYQDLRV